LGAVRRITFSRNYTLSLSRTCQCYCKYCAFATRKAHIYAPEEVEQRLDEAQRRNAKELLVLTGERPEVNPDVAARLAEWGHDDFTSYVVWGLRTGAGARHPAAHEHRRPKP
jgi:FO synthase